MNYEEVLRGLVEYAKRTVSEGAKAVILIGSLARGDYTAHSDADVIIVRDDVPERAIDRIVSYMETGLPVDVEPRVYTMKELIEMAERGARIIEEILSHGKLLAGDKEVIEDIRRTFRRRTPEDP